jgi:hypothetical protein
VAEWHDADEVWRTGARPGWTPAPGQRRRNTHDWFELAWTTESLPAQDDQTEASSSTKQDESTAA